MWNKELNWTDKLTDGIMGNRNQHLRRNTQTPPREQI